MNLPGFLLEATNIKAKVESNILNDWFTTKSTENKIGTFKEDIHLNNKYLENSLKQELSFKSLTEFYASKAILDIVKIAPSLKEYDFLNTLLIDETHHSYLFRTYLKDNGLLALTNPLEEMAEVLNHSHQQVVIPFQDFIKKWVVDKNDFYAGISIITIILEGILAPTAELSEVKWLPFYKKASEIQRYANVDEVRHLTICAEILKSKVNTNPEIKNSLQECIHEGLNIWNTSNIQNIILQRESLYQQGIEENQHLIEDYYLVDGILLKDTTPEMRLEISNSMVHQMQKSRLEYIGI
ncbi:hypothetical protein ACJOYG_01640 [Acinetobacter baumannii]